jgi:sugar lactone lactonase YvrE
LTITVRNDPTAGLYFGNGLTFSRDESYLLVQETFAMRTLRLWLKGEKAFTSDVFVDELPGILEHWLHSRYCYRCFKGRLTVIV